MELPPPWVHSCGSLNSLKRSLLQLNYMSLYCTIITGVEEITPEQSSLSLTTSLKLFITQMHDRGFDLIGLVRCMRSTKCIPAGLAIYTLVQRGVWRQAYPTQYRRYMYSSVADLMAAGSLAAHSSAVSVSILLLLYPCILIIAELL